jgi:hypothetical protein
MYLTDASRFLISCVIQHYAPVVAHKCGPDREREGEMGRERERERGGGREGEREREREKAPQRFYTGQDRVRQA